MGEVGGVGAVGEPAVGEPAVGEPAVGEPAALTVFERTFGTPHGASLEQLAGAFGIPYTLAARPGDVAKAIAATICGAGPRIVEARTGRAANADLRARMRAAAIRAAAVVK
jgi:2-succinyl-5-enolpyruvyl-6-hydroxy-3-cyclohexene-1-carboxylate synthase